MDDICKPHFKVSKKRKANDISTTTKALTVTVNVSVVKGPNKDTCEDNCKAILDLGTELSSYGKGIAYFAVIDGHGGRMAVDWVSANMASVFCRCLERNLKNRGYETMDTLCDENANAIMISSMYSAFAYAEHFLSKKEDESGVCLLICLLHRDHLLCFNSGDCGALLQRSSGISEALNVLHDVDCPGEYNWITSHNVEFHNGRVAGIIEPTRTLGDIDAKRLHPLAISHLPDLFITRLSPSPPPSPPPPPLPLSSLEGPDRYTFGRVSEHSSDMLVMCTDGVHGPFGDMHHVATTAREWEFLSYVDVDGSLGCTASKITSIATGDRKCGRDDASIIVVFFRYDEEISSDCDGGEGGVQGGNEVTNQDDRSKI